jgi:hypothetical protein
MAALALGQLRGLHLYQCKRCRGIFVPGPQLSRLSSPSRVAPSDAQPVITALGVPNDVANALDILDLFVSIFRW